MNGGYSIFGNEDASSLLEKGDLFLKEYVGGHYIIVSIIMVLLILVIVWLLLKQPLGFEGAYNGNLGAGGKATAYNDQGLQQSQYAGMERLDSSSAASNVAALPLPDASGAAPAPTVIVTADVADSCGSKNYGPNQVYSYVLDQAQQDTTSEAYTNLVHMNEHYTVNDSDLSAKGQGY